MNKIIAEAKENSTVFDMDSFDIFGNIKNDKTKVSVLSNKKHRESEKDKYKILDIYDGMKVKEFEETLNEKISILDKAIIKSKAIADINIYCATTEKMNLDEIQIFYINPADALKSQEGVNKVSLNRIKIKEGMNLIYNTNIIYYDNINNTLPVGMNVSSTVLFDMSKYKLELKKQKIFRMNEDKSNFDFNEKIVCAYEYEVKE